ncbi:hypothetical protein EC844_103162 [Acinetobacter calcoaceticus]|uniref:Uncharacterized protein n=1 Tax=Acinetobacter calcoaceticus TaxID=471 RepID=A0A4R1Y2X0_ACICA|nr:hypothetical protein EC844_103162 [Acinetobacter calcoaceticus]
MTSPPWIADDTTADFIFGRMELEREEMRKCIEVVWVVWPKIMILFNQG